MSKQKPQYLVSTDSIGFLGNPEQFLFLWQDFFNDKTLDGVEVIAFKPLLRLEKLADIFKKNNIPILAFHGKTGGESQLDFFGKIIMTLVNLGIFNIETLLKNFPEIDFLSHSPYFENNLIKQIILQQKPGRIWVENHLPGIQGVNDAIKQINIYRENNINALGMFDVFHFISHMKLKEFFKNWGEIVGQIENYNQFFTGIHFPIGTRLDDSLPIDNMTDEMLQLFAEKIIPNVERVVFENQQNFPGLFFSTERMLLEQKFRNKRIIERLKKTGIIKL